MFEKLIRTEAITSLEHHCSCFYKALVLSIWLLVVAILSTIFNKVNCRQNFSTVSIETPFPENTAVFDGLIFSTSFIRKLPISEQEQKSIYKPCKQICIIYKHK